MIPFSRMFVYGNIAPTRPKIRYDFSSGVPVSTGQITGVLTQGSYLDTGSGVYGILNASMNVPSFLIAQGNWMLECEFYVNSTASSYGNGVAFNNSGIQFGDSGFGNRLRAGSNLGVLAGSYITPNTRTTLFRQRVKFKLERINNVTKLYLNDVVQNFATGTGTSYTNSSISDTYDVPAATVLSIGTGSVALISFILDF